MRGEDWDGCKGEPARSTNDQPVYDGVRQSSAKLPRSFAELDRTLWSSMELGHFPAGAETCNEPANEKDAANSSYDRMKSDTDDRNGLPVGTKAAG